MTSELTFNNKHLTKKRTNKTNKILNLIKTYLNAFHSINMCLEIENTKL